MTNLIENIGAFAIARDGLHLRRSSSGEAGISPAEFHQHPRFWRQLRRHGKRAGHCPHNSSGLNSANYKFFAGRYPTGRLSGGSNYVDNVSGILNLAVANYAIGGATTGASNVTVASFPGFSQEIASFAASGARISASDLVLLHIGGNDASAYQSVGNLAGVPAAAAVSASQALSGINYFIADGARTIVYNATNSALEPSNAGKLTTPIGLAFNAAYNADVRVSLAASARSGVRGRILRRRPACIGDCTPVLVSTASATPGRAHSPASAIPPCRPSISTTSMAFTLPRSGFAVLGELRREPA